MMDTPPTGKGAALPSQVLHAFVCGKIPWSELARVLRADISFEKGLLRYRESDIYRGQSLLMSDGDLAAGFLNRLAAGPDALREWAAVIIACDQIQFNTEDEPGMRLNDILTNAAWGELPSRADLDFLEAHAHGSRGRVSE